QPQIAEKQAMSRMAEQGISVAQTEYRQATEQVSQARAEVAGKTAAVRDAQSAISAAEAERAQAEAELSSAQSMIANTEAELDAARAQNEYAQAQAERTRSLQRAGAASGEEAQRDTAMAADASAKVRQAQSAVLQAKAEVRAKQSAINKAGAMLKGSQAKLAQMTSDLDGARAGVRVAQAAADTARARIKQAAAGVAQARASEAQSATQKDYAEIRAEVDGVVTQRLISPGTLVNPGQTVLKVAQISPIRLQANVPDTDLEKVRVGTLVSIINKAGTGSALNARITSVAPGVDAASRMGVVEAVVPNTDRRFLPGQYVAMSISTGRQSTALKVPSSAIQWRTKASGSTLSTVSTPSVWVAEPADKGQFTVQSVGVKVGLSGGGFTEITSGLTAGQKVVTIGANTLNDYQTNSGETSAPVAATEAVNLLPTAFAAAPDGTLYVVDRAGVRRIGADGILRDWITFVFAGAEVTLGSPAAVESLRLSTVTAIAVGGDGTIALSTARQSVAISEGTAHPLGKSLGAGGLSFDPSTGDIIAAGRTVGILRRTASGERIVLASAPVTGDWVA
ncbi:MAG: efflux RND transporter periplasmic adaptor subunit, partial [Armatimonadetes bacterium]|nr:efflux RND transporter periplasmic adaptor subunit [Armatimonadota bacterium]